ncbi:hypothetical protein JRQ81_015906 [Phrynocephalus forsythii]|uniref:Uncharacterized protein n=1 Tax=Phrynocephalus forsythii TaxID=171643 RepID=A0A9Q1B2Q7_9SAUR|nr:hypothetical protein JRQ81_015906 [Phrynocephalus forsythii]
MQSMGIISNALNGVGSSEAAGLFINNRANLMSDYEFIHCFRRDSNKVQNYFRVLKFRIVPGNTVVAEMKFAAAEQSARLKLSIVCRK